MNTFSSCILADTSIRTFWQLSRLQQLTQWWHWMLLVSSVLLIFAYVVRLYRRDSSELSAGLRGTLLLLRLAALLGLLLFFLDLEKRSERRVTRTSRAVVLVDTSQSMGLTDLATGQTSSRLEQVTSALRDGPLIPELQQRHDVSIYAFGGAEPPTTLALLKRQTEEKSDSIEAPSAEGILTTGRLTYYLATGFAVVGFLFWLTDLALQRRVRGAEGEAYLSLAAVVAWIAAFVIAAVANLRYPELTWRNVWAGEATVRVADAATAAPDAIPVPESNSNTPSSPQRPWHEQLVARGVETRIGDALRWILDREREAPVAGFVLITDGQNNAGMAPTTMIRAAQSAEIGLYPVGIGSEKQPKSVRLVDLEAPPRVYPGDRFTITGYLQAFGWEGRTLSLQLESVAESSSSEGATQPTATENAPLERRVTLPRDGQMVTIPFEVTPTGKGRTTWRLKVAVDAQEDLDPRDNQRTAVVEVVDRKNRVMIIAGGPNRDYHFLRNQLYRDGQTQVDVWLQSALPGAAQESNEVLLEFPTDRESLFEYDTIVAFDPNWNLLSTEQVDMLDEWVAEKAGGLILVAGPVHTSQWSRGDRSGSEDAKLSKIRSLYPVTFYSRGAATIQLGRVSAETPWPLQFSEDGKRSQFLWLEDSPGENEQAWSRFAGVFGYQAVKDVKPGAVIYARFSDPQSTFGDEQPVYLAGQFYGAGRVLYLGSGEMWRLNELDTRYFETLYTKLIRHVSQGRLLRDSSHGLLLVDNERASLGDTITLRATLSDAQYQPLTLESVPATLVRPDGQKQPMKLNQLPNSERPGTYTGQFTATQEGDHEVQLAIPGIENELLRRSVKIRLPARETEQPQRNDSLLVELARETRGQYYVGLDATLGNAGQGPLARQLPVKDQVTYVPGTPDQAFQRRLMSWLMAWIAGVLSLEWLVRRWNRLA